MGTRVTACQIRIGLCKGMLVIDPTLTGVQLLLRPSMIKGAWRARRHRCLEVKAAAKIKKAGNMLFCQAIIVISNMLMEQGDRRRRRRAVPPQVRFPCVVTSTRITRFFV